MILILGWVGGLHTIKTILIQKEQRIPLNVCITNLPCFGTTLISNVDVPNQAAKYIYIKANLWCLSLVFLFLI